MKNKIIALSKFISAFTLILLFSISAMAQDKKEDRAKLVTDNMNTQLKLTDVQYKEVYDVNYEFLTKSKEIKATETDKVVKRESLKENNDIRETKLKQILTAEQYLTYLENRKESKKKLNEALQQRGTHRVNNVSKLKIKQ